MLISSVTQNTDYSTKTETPQKSSVSIWNDVPQTGRNDIITNTDETSAMSVFDKKIDELAKKLADKFENFTKEDLINFFKNCGIDLNEVASREPDRINGFFKFWEERISECNSLEELNQMAELIDTLKIWTNKIIYEGKINEKKYKDLQSKKSNLLKK